MNNLRAISILLVDDDPEDIEMTMEILKMQKIKLDISTATDGVEALQYLSDNQNNLPDLILLDLNMPRKNGHEVLKEIKSNSELKHIPVIILTSSKACEDIDASYHKGANCYISKPVGFHEFKKVVDAINNFWFSVVKYPEK